MGPGIIISAPPPSRIQRAGGSVIVTTAGAVTIAPLAGQNTVISSGNLGIASGAAYTYNNVNVVRAQTALFSYYLANAGNLTSTGTYNLFAGIDAGLENTSGGNNTFIGAEAGATNDTGGSNTFIGDNAGGSTAGGSQNTFVGRQAGVANVTGANNTFIGYGAGSATTSITNATALGNGAQATASNQVMIGNGSITTTVIAAGTLNMSNGAILNIGAAGTDFSATGGLTLAGALVVSANGAAITGASSITGNLTIGAFTVGLSSGAISGNWTASGLVTYTVSNSPGMIYLNTAVQNRLIAWLTSSSLRWNAGANSTAEGGANAGSDWVIQRWDDAGAYLGLPVSIARATGLVTLANGLITPGILTMGAAAASRSVTQPTNAINLFSGTAPSGTLTNGATFYVAAGEMTVMDAGGVATTISPHDDDGNWVFASRDTVKKTRLLIDVEKLLRFVNDHHQLDFVHDFVEREKEHAHGK